MLKVSDVDLIAGTIRLRDSNGEVRKVALTQDAKNLLGACVTGKAPEDAVFTRGKRAVKGLSRDAGQDVCHGRFVRAALLRSATERCAEQGVGRYSGSHCAEGFGRKTRNVFGPLQHHKRAASCRGCQENRVKL